jgi:hypothetical protein
MLQRIEKIKSKMNALEEEKLTLTRNLKSSISDMFNDNVLTKCEFNALVGGILFVQNTLIKNATNDHVIIEQWKKEGSNFTNKSIKIKKPKTAKSKKIDIK